MTPRRLITLGSIAALAAAAAWLARRAPAVETRPAVRGPIAEWVEGTGKARVRERHVVAAPAAGALERIEVHAGDRVRAGAAVAHVRPMTPAPLDARTRAATEARLAAARAAELEADAGLRRARVAEADAARVLSRSRALVRGSALSERDLEAAESAALAAGEQVLAARGAVERARAERRAVETLLAAPRTLAAGSLPVVSPVEGVVLRVRREDPGPIEAGTPILEVGDPGALEVALELLTEQAARVRPGAPVEVGGWGGDPVAGVVRRIEPSAFTKVSALGVEEQRVLVLVDPAGEGAPWAALGDGWRVEGRVVVAQRGDAVKVPASAAFRSERGWQAFVVEGGRARLRDVRIGATGADEVEIVSGIAGGERVILRPTSALGDGVRVRAR
jgi:HlyD family secretion protein